MGLDSEINELVEGSDLYEPKVITITTTTTTPYHTPYHTPSQPTLSPHPLNPPSYSHSPTPTHPTLSTHPLNPPSPSPIPLRLIYVKSFYQKDIWTHF